MLRMDGGYRWIAKFESDLRMCSSLIADGFSNEDLAELSNSITYVFQGTGSFNDYAPSVYNEITGRYSAIPGTEEFEAVTSELFDLAVELRVSGFDS